MAELWRERLRPGDVVRRADGTLGRIITIQQYTPDDPALYELHVDTVGGVELWNPEFTDRAEEAALREEAARLELRGPVGSGPP